MEKCLLKYFPIFIIWLSLYYCYKSSLYILDNNSLSDAWFSSIFFQLGVVFLFTFLMMSFEAQKVFISDEVRYLELVCKFLQKKVSWDFDNNFALGSLNIFPYVSISINFNHNLFWHSNGLILGQREHFQIGSLSFWHMFV